jgi:hypothetical protein
MGVVLNHLAMPAFPKLEVGLIALFFCFFSTISKLPEIPLCPAVWFGGIGCPACGTTRSVWSIMHAQFVDAWALNPIGYVVVLAMIRRLVVLATRKREAFTALDSHAVDQLLIYSFFALALVNYIHKFEL